jgi:hypothetical protein
LRCAHTPRHPWDEPCAIPYSSGQRQIATCVDRDMQRDAPQRDIVKPIVVG